MDLFKALVEYHCTHNLENWLKEATICDKKHILEVQHKLKEGMSENHLTKGALILATNSDIINYLCEAHVVTEGYPLDHRRGWNRVNQNWQLHDIISDEDAHDCSFVFDYKLNQITRIFEFNNDRRLDGDFSDYVPRHFISTQTPIDLAKIGSAKTKNAIRVPVHYMNKVIGKLVNNQEPLDHYITGEIRASISKKEDETIEHYLSNNNFESFLLKTSPYANVRIGKVAHFDSKGLVKEFFFLYDKDFDKAKSDPSLYINPENKIVGVMRSYRKDSDLIKGENGLIPNMVPDEDKPSKLYLEHCKVYALHNDLKTLTKLHPKYVGSVLNQNAGML